MVMVMMVIAMMTFLMMMTILQGIEKDMIHMTTADGMKET